MTKRMAAAIIFTLLISIFSQSIFLRINDRPAITMAQSRKGENIKDIVADFLPENMELSPFMMSKRAKSIIYKDLDGDKEKEILFTFKSVKEDNTGGLIILKKEKKEKEEWKEVLRDFGKGRLVCNIYYEDIDGDNKDELLLGSFIGASEGNDLKVYKFNEDDFEFELIGEEGYHKILIRDMPDSEGKCDGKSEIAIWQRATGDVYAIKVLRYGEERLVEARDVYPYYFSRVVDYYKSELKKDYNKNNALMWYYLVDAQLKSNKPKEALNTIHEVKKNRPDGYDKMKKMFYKLEKQAISSFKL
ncbi:hypothetical protein GOM49_00555 [Clostridium bovifaecis]|uniref:Uncharacterized protein n=1 Tax=Clostridium bovifaecis TaxID=2184719 RepID=A0A6I6EP33_9CLOT|nr:hypothetical protein GOM49_00555 [Clostridium bovifaecis]